MEKKKKQRRSRADRTSKKRKRNDVRDDQARTCTHVVAKEGGRSEKFLVESERQTISKTLHKWTPDSAKALDA